MRTALALSLALLLAPGCTTAAKRAKAVARVDLGTAYLREGNPQSAIVVLEQAVRYDKKSWDAWNKLGLAYMARGAEELSEKAFKRALRLEPGQAEINNNYGLLLMSQGRLEEAVEVFETANADLTYRSGALVLSNLGFALLQLDRLDESISALDDAIKRAPNLCQARFHRGLAWQRKGDSDQALADLDAVIALCGDEAPGAYFHGAQVLLTTGDTTGACTYLRTVLRESALTDLADKAADLYNEECE